MTVALLFVCLGNICRSPTAHGVMLKQVADSGLGERISVDSAGTGDWHIGHAPDARSRAAAQRRGYDLEGLRARQVCSADFRRFDYILAMDRGNLAELQRTAPADATARVELFLGFAQDPPVLEVPDPYYGGAQGFEQVLDLVEAASAGLLAHIRRTHF
jgi:protein-tyrosine phosphatase